MPVKINGATNGSVTLAAPATGSDVTLTLPAAAGTVATTAYADSAGGLQLITTQTFSAVSSLNVNNCFSATYQNYRVLIRLTDASSAGNVLIRMRAAGTDDSGSNYSLATRFFGSDNSTGNQTSSNSTTNIVLLYGDTTFDDAVAAIDISGPFLTAETLLMGEYIYRITGDLTYWVGGGGIHKLTNSYDGFSLLANSGNITGTVRVYGYKN